MSDLDTNREIAGRYRVVRFIGRGGMGAVYEVEHLHTGQHLAMKVLTGRQSPEVVERFKREARAASRIPSDHIVRVTDADTAPELGGSPFLVMDLLGGMDLEHAAGDVSVAPEVAVEWLRQVARGLTKAHDAGIIHRDLKPENLFLTRREDGAPLVKILDFGIAKLTEEGATLTQPDQFLGTPAYMAPEQADSRGSPVTAAADLYALGLIAYRLLVGQMYWRDGSLAQLLAQVLTEKMTAPSERGSTLGPGFDAWLLRACDRDATKRFGSAVEQIEALAEALGMSRRAATETPPSTTKAALTTLEAAPTLGASSRELAVTGAPRRWRRWAAAGAVVAAGVLGLVAFTRGAATEKSIAPEVAAASTPSAAVAPVPVEPPAPSQGASIAPTATMTVDASPPRATASSATAPPQLPVNRKRPGGTPRASTSKDPLEGQY